MHMKLAVFGCSHTGIGPRHFDETWPYHLQFRQKDTKVHITNFALGGTSTQFQYEIFKNEIDNFDKFIFQFTQPFRLTEQLGPLPPLSKHMSYKYLDPKLFNYVKGTAGSPNKNYNNWVKNDKGDILKEYKKICLEVSSHEKCLYSFHVFKNHSERDKIDILAKIFPKMLYSTDIHLSSKQNVKISSYIKEKCKL